MGSQVLDGHLEFDANSGIVHDETVPSDLHRLLMASGIDASRDSRVSSLPLPIRRFLDRCIWQYVWKLRRPKHWGTDVADMSRSVP